VPTTYGEKIKMNVETGEIKEVAELTPEEVASKMWKEIGHRPNPGCKRCHGRGYIGRNITTNTVVICRCVKKRP